MNNSDHGSPPFWRALWVWGLPGLTLLALAWIAGNAFLNPGILFLGKGPAPWITYPIPPRLRAYAAINLYCTFRRTLDLPEKPVAAELAWRCMTNGLLYINGVNVPLPAPSANWKKTQTVDIAPYLRPGTNLIALTAFNAAGPPALSAAVRCGAAVWKTDETWEGSIAGSAWQRAQYAWRVPAPKPGNALDTIVTTSGAFQRCWPGLCVMGAIAAGATLLLRFFVARCAASLVEKVVLFAVGSFWILLFAHNFPVVPADAGFDAKSHLEYVNYIQEYRMLPAAFEGWEMFQAPLFYIVSAVLLAVTHTRITDFSGLMVLRFFSLAIGWATLVLVYSGLRALFPGDWKKRLAGTVFAAFLPAQIGLLHYTTNETLSAMFVTAGLALAVLILRADKTSWKWYGGLGVILGLALLSKASAVVAIPGILGVLGLKLILRRERAPQVWLTQVLVPIVLCLLIGGWHYLKLWHAYGNPFTGNWNPKMGAAWWQYKGLQTPAYYFSIGAAFTRPFFSGIYGFWDGLYTTLWGDGMLGGRIDMVSPAPWNFDLMTAGFILALAPTFFVLTGMVGAVLRCFRTGDLALLLLLAVAWLYAFAILAMSFKVPSYAQTKAFYGLPALLGFCAFGALGFDYWMGRARSVAIAVGAAATMWLITVYGSFWIRPGTIQARLAYAIASSYLKEDGASQYREILRQRPGERESALGLAFSECEKDPALAIRDLSVALTNNPNDGGIENEMAQCFLQAKNFDQAAAHARRAVQLAPGDERCSEMLCEVDLMTRNFVGAVEAGREALSVDPTALAAHVCLGEALIGLRQYPEAEMQLQMVTDYEPESPDAQFFLGLCLLREPGNQARAIDHLTTAVSLNPTNAAWQGELQKATQGH